MIMFVMTFMKLDLGGREEEREGKMVEYMMHTMRVNVPQGYVCVCVCEACNEPEEVVLVQCSHRHVRDGYRGSHLNERHVHFCLVIVRGRGRGILFVNL